MHVNDENLDAGHADGNSGKPVTIEEMENMGVDPAIIASLQQSLRRFQQAIAAGEEPDPADVSQLEEFGLVAETL